MDTEVLRLQPGEDLRDALDGAFRRFQSQGVQAASVVSSVGSLSQAVLRFAAEPGGTVLHGPLEMISLSGTLSRDGCHLHASVADAQGAMRGGHVMRGCTVRTTAEIVLALLPGWHFSREADPATGYLELVALRTSDDPQPDVSPVSLQRSSCHAKE